MDRSAVTTGGRPQGTVMGAVALAVALAALAPACGADKEGVPAGAANAGEGTLQAATPAGPPASAASVGAAAQPAGQTVETVARNGRTVTLSDGTVVTLPPKPRRTSIPPQRGCRKRTYRTSRGRRAIYFPPRPGIAAERTDRRTVTVRYRFYRFDRRCKPHIVDLTVRDADDASFPATDEQVEVRALRGTVRIELPDRVLGADTVAVRAYTRRGLPSDSGIVRIRDTRQR